MAQWTAEHPRNLEREPEISMSRGLRNKSARGIDARTDRDTFVDSALEAKDRTTEVTYRRETPHQRRFSLPRSQELEIVRIGGHKDHLRRRRHECVPMSV